MKSNMSICGISHIALSVRHIDTSLVFYLDTMGFKMVRDEVEEITGTVLEKLCEDSHKRRRVVTLYWKLAKGSTFLVLSEYGDCAGTGEPPKLDQVGIHHLGLWVDDLTATYNELEGRGVKSVMPLTSFAQPMETFVARCFGPRRDFCPTG